MRHVRLLLAFLLAAALSTSCGLLGGSDDDGGDSSGKGGLEHTKISVTLCCGALDPAPFRYAMKKGYFKDEGFTDIEITTVPDGGSAVTKVVSGESQIAMASYAPMIAAQAQADKEGGDKGGLDLKLIADATALAPNNSVIVTAPNSNIKSVRQLKGKRIAITAPNTLTDFLVQSVLETGNVDPKSYKPVATPFPQMADALLAGHVDAALLVEPFLTQGLMAHGLVELADCSTGPTAEIPIGGYTAQGDFVEKNPKTVEAFQRVMVKATKEAQEDTSILKPIVMETGKLDEQTVDLLRWTSYQTSLDPVRIQRVADLMAAFGTPSGDPYQVKPMIVQPST